MSPLTLSLVLATVALGVVLAAVGHRYHRRRKRRVERENTYWSIGYQRSSHPLRWDPGTAKVYSKHQASAEVRTLADPFIIERGEEIYLFCEVLDASPKGKIGVSVYDRTRDAWRFESIVLDEPFHLSYPYVFADDSDVYMVPEAKGSRSVRLYKATTFPTEWKLEKVLVENRKLVDPSIVLWNGRCYLFASRRGKLYLYHADTLTGNWAPHRRSPMYKGHAARCAGRIIESEGCLHRFTQESGEGFRLGVCGYRILQLSEDDFKEVPLEGNPLFGPCAASWAKGGMHHLDVLKLRDDGYLAVFDGRGVVT